VTESEKESIHKYIKKKKKKNKKKKKKKNEKKCGTFGDTCRGCRHQLKKESVTCTRRAVLCGTV
jgi:hypothetical protein